MSNTATIFKVRENKFQPFKIQKNTRFHTRKDNPIDIFTENLRKAGGKLVNSMNISLQKLIHENFKEALNIISVYDGYNGTRNISEFSKPHKLQDV
ncbi:MAG: hypothetical protein ABFS35_16190 [Bacteroidota bacterium]